MCTRETKQLHSSQQLPMDVWQCIASHLSTKQWRHWSSAVTLKLARKQAGAVSWVIAYDAPPLRALERLHISLQEESSPASTVFPAWLMCQPTGLHWISIKAPAAIVVPPLRMLRHLMVQADTFDDGAIVAVCQLHGLQTLWQASKNNNLGGSNHQMCRLALGSMASLTELSIDGISPAAIDLPRRCKLHISAQPKDLASWNWWAGAAQAGQLASLHLFLEKPDPGPAMPNFLAATGCTTLFWNTQNIGELNEPVVFAAPAFAALSALYLDATAVCISIHASMRLRALHIAANTLTVGFGNLEALAISLEELSLVYKWGNCGVVEVALALQRVGKVVEKVVAPMEDGYEGIGTRQDLVYRQNEPWPCTCGACLRCL